MPWTGNVNVSARTDTARTTIFPPWRTGAGNTGDAASAGVIKNAPAAEIVHRETLGR